jgi:glycosyltransferase involved in cell wall biosynthesis
VDPLSGVLFVIDNLEFGGGERGFLQLVRGLAAHGERVGVAAHPGGVFEADARAVGAAFFPLDMRARFAAATVRRLRAIVGGQGFAVVHSQGARADFTARLALAGLAGVGHVCTVQMPVEGFDVGPLRRALYVALDRLTAARVDRFIVVSRALERLLVEGRGVPAERVRLIPNGVELPRAQPATAPAAMRTALGIAAGGRVIGAVGRLVWQKGFEHLIRAMRVVVAAEPAARLVVVGDGPLRHRLATLSAECGVDGCVTFAGFRRDVTALLRAFEILVVPSLREGLPMITLEGMAAGTPVVATAIPGILEQIDSGVDGMLVPPGDADALAAAVVRLLGDAALRDRLGAAARRKAATAFDVSRTVAATREVYAGLMRELAVPAR